MVNEPELAESVGEATPLLCKSGNVAGDAAFAANAHDPNC